jgi:hypothetical protein
MGQTGDSDYIQLLKDRFPGARLIPPLGPMGDFELMRRSNSIVCSVSTFSWLAAWLSNAETVFLPLAGLFNPFQNPTHGFIPTNDARFKYFIFPQMYARPPDQLLQMLNCPTLESHLVSAEQINGMVHGFPRFRPGWQDYILAFDEKFYLSKYKDVEAAVASGHFPSGVSHFVSAGINDGRLPCFVDDQWYVNAYPKAAWELGCGDFQNALEHYLCIGRVRQYSPVQQR